MKKKLIILYLWYFDKLVDLNVFNLFFVFVHDYSIKRKKCDELYVINNIRKNTCNWKKSASG